MKLFEENTKWIDGAERDDQDNTLTIQIKLSALGQENISKDRWVSIAESSGHMILCAITKDIVTFMN